MAIDDKKLIACNPVDAEQEIKYLKSKGLNVVSRKSKLTEKQQKLVDKIVQSIELTSEEFDAFISAESTGPNEVMRQLFRDAKKRGYR